LSGGHPTPVEDHEEDAPFEEAGITYEDHEIAPPTDAYAEYEAEKAAAQQSSDELTDDTYDGSEAETVQEAKRPEESWWQQPEHDVPSEDAADEQTPAVVAEGLSEIPSAGSDDDEEVEEDTEAFLEKVFSELDSSETDPVDEDDSETSEPEEPEDSDTSEPEDSEGHGLLRRRRMGTLRDFSSDS
jgi:hypothetical protein